ncbi:MAG: AAA family ATPase [Deltaproteobacteria bacterium]|nr:AAA family ATPase [Deltaproteobacteria bacterium]
MCAALVPSTALHRSCQPAEIPFDTTADVAGTQEILGQDRAVEALRFGIGIRQPGYNVFAIGPPGVGKKTLVRQLLDQRAGGEATPSDLCYVHDFGDPHKPRALEMPAGLGSRLASDMARAVAELQVSMRGAFESDEYRTRRHKLVSESKDRQERAFAEAQERARQRRIAIARTEAGIVVAPLRGEAPLEAADFRRLPKDEQERLHAQMERVGAELEELFRKFHDWSRQHHEALQELDREIATSVAHRVVEAVREGYREQPRVVAYLAEVEADVIEHADDFLQGEAEGLEAAFRRALRREQQDGPSFRRYQVNVLVDNAEQKGAPVVYEDNPTFSNLVGRIEHESQFGALVTNFTLIKAGAFHRAAGGYLLLDALKVLEHPFAWEAIKRTIRSAEVRIESLGQALGLQPTVTLEPEPFPLGNTKVILFGDRRLHYLLALFDPELSEIVKVVADFEESMDRSPETHGAYAQLVATLVRKEALRPLGRDAVARVIDHAARWAEDAEKLSVHMRPIVDLIREADFCAQSAGHPVVSAVDVQSAIDAQLRRAGRLRERLLEAILRQSILIDTSGEKVGQINGLSVIQLGEYFFGHPTRITARARVGKGELVDIEREVELGGPLHSKGVLILAGFLGARYAAQSPLSLSASLVFEQSYSPVEGDSASLAELCSLLSALSELPLRQSMAVTGSVDQHGHIQAIGGVNAKIEGFFDVCQKRGLTGDQGVIVPQSNVKNLMVRRDVVEAVEARRFGIYAVSDVDEAMELLTGRPAGARDAEGRFADQSVNALVDARLAAFAESTRAFLSRAPIG